MKNNKLNAVKEHWEDVKTVSLKDNNLQLLERRTILDFIERTKKNTLKDIGCGDGSDTKFFAEKFKLNTDTSILKAKNLSLFDSTKNEYFLKFAVVNLNENKFLGSDIFIAFED